MNYSFQGYCSGLFCYCKIIGDVKNSVIELQNLILMAKHFKHILISNLTKFLLVSQNTSTGNRLLDTRIFCQQGADCASIPDSFSLNISFKPHIYKCLTLVTFFSIRSSFMNIHKLQDCIRRGRAFL